MSKYLLTCLFLWPICSFGQNLVANSDFEDVNICKKYNESCSPKAWRSMSLKLFGYNDGKFGKYISVLLYDVARKNDRKFAQTELLCPLIKGEKYKIKFKVKTDHFWINNVTLCFLDSMIFMKKVILNELPKTYITFKIPQNSETDQWLHIEGIYLAKGNEKFLLLGNLQSDDLTESSPLDKKWHKKHLKSYDPKRRIQYGFDDVEMTPLDSSLKCDCNKKRLTLILNDSIRHELKRPLTKDVSLEIAVKETKTLEEKKGIIEKLEVMPKLVFKNLKFEHDQWKLSEMDIPKLNKLANVLISNTQFNITIIGFTDALGSEKYNLELSRKRSESVRNYLLQKGVNFKRMTIIGQGEQFAVGKKNDRRVEVIFN